MSEQLREHKEVIRRPRSQREKSPLKLGLNKFSKIRERWSSYDPINVLKMPFEDRLELASLSVQDANFCRDLAINNPTLASSEQGRKLSRFAELRGWETQLRLDTMFLVPELMDNDQVDAAVESGILLSREFNDRESRVLEDMPMLIKLQDVMSLEAFWKYRESKTDIGRSIAKGMLGDVILDSVQDIVGLTKILQRSYGKIPIGAVNDARGEIAEYMMVTWERLNLFLDKDEDALGNTFIRSALKREDEGALDKTKSLDSVIMQFGKKEEERGVRLLQYKLGQKERDYDPSITVRHVTGLRQVMDLYDDDNTIINIAKKFHELITRRDPISRQAAMDYLRSYFEESQVSRVTA